jgi:hypothetical protein
VTYNSKPATEFYNQIYPGMKFKARADRKDMPDAGSILTVRGRMKTYATLDDSWYFVANEEGHERQVRGWWLRQNWEVVED